MSLWSFIKEKISPIKNIVSQGLSYLNASYKIATTAINYLLSLSSVRNNAYNFSMQFLEGFRSILNPKVLSTIVNNDETKSIYSASIKLNIIYYLSVIVAYEIASHALLPNFNDEYESKLETTLWAVDKLVKFGFVGLATHRIIDNMLINLAVAKTVAEKNPAIKPYAACECDTGKHLQATLASSLYFSFNLFSLSYIPYFRYIGLPLVYGQSTIEFELGAAGKCIEHMIEDMTKNNAYAFGVGLSYFILLKSGAALIESITGAQSYFIEAALSSLLYPYFIAAALLRKKPLPGKEPGWDFFYYQRLLVHDKLKEFIGFIVAGVQNQEMTFDWSKLRKAFANFPLLPYINTVIKDWNVVDAYKTAPANIVFLDAYYATIQQKLDETIALRDKPILERPLTEIPKALLAPHIPNLPNRIANLLVTDEFKWLIKIIFHENTGDSLKGFKRFLEDTRLKQINVKRKKQGLEPLFSLDVNKPSVTQVKLSENSTKRIDVLSYERKLSQPTPLLEDNNDKPVDENQPKVDTVNLSAFLQNHLIASANPVASPMRVQEKEVPKKQLRIIQGK